jgi:predicted deacetylase
VNAAISIHDVAPDTVDQTKRLLELVREAADGIVTLLVIPGKPWSDEDLAWLRGLHDQKCRLAGHGWSHQAVDRRDLYHRFHSALISRDVAEHLSRPESELVQLMKDCHQWFYDNELPHPVVYVPPAWAMGQVSRRALRGLPFRYFETLRGIYDGQADCFHKSNVIGYEADTALRQTALNLSNELAIRTARGPLRLGIHPHDLELRLAETLRAHLREISTSLSYPELCQAS